MDKTNVPDLILPPEHKQFEAKAGGNKNVQLIVRKADAEIQLAHQQDNLHPADRASGLLRGGLGRGAAHEPGDGHDEPEVAEGAAEAADGGGLLREARRRGQDADREKGERDSANDDDPGHPLDSRQKIRGPAHLNER
jgi:hypothetical protein